MKITETLNWAAKAVTAFVGVALTVLYFANEEGLVSDDWQPWLRVAIVAAVTFGVWKVPNGPRPATATEPPMLSSGPVTDESEDNA